MKFEIKKALEILEKTPRVIRVMLYGLSAEWIHASEGEGTWTPYDVVGHLIHGEKTDWIPRMRIILGDGPEKRFEPFDMKAHLKNGRNRPFHELLDDFESLRRDNLRALQAAALDEDALGREGIHPEFGVVTLRQMLATWVTHDLGHIAQIARVMAKQYKDETGPWVKYIVVLNQ